MLAFTVFGAEREWVELFDGQTLSGWKASENPGTFSVKDGAIVAQGPRAHLFYTGPEMGAGFRNFEFSAEVKAAAGANSGIYFHTAWQETDWPNQGFEVQINNSARRHGDYLELKKTGSLYGIRNIYKQLVADDAWFRMRITVRANRVQIRVDDFFLVDYVQPQPGPRGQSRLPGLGTFALQGHDPESRVSFRNMRVRRLADDLPVEPARATEREGRVLRLGGDNFPLVDLHTHLKGGLTLEELLEDSRRSGFGHGIAVNCGLGFAITNDAGIEEFWRRMPPSPVFVAMQAEGREWVNLFSKAAIKRFDYVFTDSMTIKDHRGRRTRLWMPDEVEVPDAEAFMEHLVRTIEGIFAAEPIDVYVNPTFLPDVIAADYDRLWTTERQRRVIEAAKRHGIAIEISSRYRLPKPDFIKAAKRAGLKFTFGTNNGGREILRNDYGLEMVRECALTWDDMWLPGQK